jgi:hypothetical protein
VHDHCGLSLLRCGLIAVIPQHHRYEQQRDERRCHRCDGDPARVHATVLLDVNRLPVRSDALALLRRR